MVVEKPAEAADEVRDLDVGAAHGAGRVVAAEDAGEYRVQLGVLGFFVRVELFDQKPVDVADHGEGTVGGNDADGVGGGADGVEVGSQGGVLGAEPAGQVGVGVGSSRLV